MRTTWEFWKYYKLQKSNNRNKPMPKWLDSSIFTEMDWWSQQNKIVQWIPFQSFFSFEPTGSLIKQTSKVTIKISFLPSCPVFLSLLPSSSSPNVLLFQPGKIYPLSTLAPYLPSHFPFGLKAQNRYHHHQVHWLLNLICPALLKPKGGALPKGCCSPVFTLVTTLPCQSHH